MALIDIIGNASGSIKGYLPIVFLLICAIYALSNRYQRGLHRVPGPLIRSFSTLPRVLSVWTGQSQDEDLELHRKYGKIVRIAPNIVSITDLAEVNTLYGITTKFVKSGFYSLSEVYDEEGKLIPDPFILKDKVVHSRMKRNAANAYSLQGLIQMEPYVDEVVDKLLEKLDGYCLDGSICDLGVILKDFSMDAVFSLTFGTNLDFINRGDEMGMYRTLDVATSYMAVFGQVPWIHKYLLANPTLAGWVIGGEKEQMYMVNLAAEETDKGKLRITEDGPMTFLQRLVMNQKANPSSITDFEILTHTWGNIAAGSDTTATAMRAVVYHLLRDRRVYDKLCAEVRSSLSTPVSFSSANSVSYLEACTREAMRLHPSVGMILGRTVPDGGVTICGHKLGAGTEVGINPWIIQRDPVIFPDPNSYIPERWLSSSSNVEQLKQMNRAFFAFGHGAHTCSGRHISMLETIKLIPTLLLRYDMELVNSGSKYRFVNHWFTTQKGLQVVLKKRGA